jgi:cytosine/uracil/thiamine/allantoin permease
MMLFLSIYLLVKSGTFSFGSEIPQDVLLKATADAGVPGTPGSFAALAAVAATWITYFAALYLNFCDFSRYATSESALRKGNLWGLPINLLAFCLVAGVTTTAAFSVYNEVLLHPTRYRRSSTAGSWRCLPLSPSPSQRSASTWWPISCRRPSTSRMCSRSTSASSAVATSRR